MAKERLTSSERAKRRHRHIRQLKGALFVVLAVVGLLSILGVVVGRIQAGIRQRNDPEQYASLIYPLSLLDPLPFEEVGLANNDVLLESALMAVMQYEDLSKYAQNDYDQVLIPRVDAERYYTKMYGSETLPAPHTFSDGTLTFSYDEKREAYAMPTVSWTRSYTTRIASMETVAGERIVAVDYYELASGADPANLTEENRIKTMYYVLAHENSDWRIRAVRTEAEQN